MSFDMFLGCFHNGEGATFPREILDVAFGRFADQSDPECWLLSFPDGGTAELSLDDEPEIGDFMVSDPPDSAEFWQGLYDVLKQTPSVLYWPGEGDCAVVADPSVIAALPPDMIETLGTPAVVHGPEDILARLEAT